jgi:hypothetical protein
MSTPETNEPTFTPFWPLCLLALSLLIFLGWQTTLSARQYMATVRALDQQALVEGQAAEAERRLQSLMLDLVLLAKTDADARLIATRYQIRYNPPPTQVPPGAQPAGTTR